MCGMPTAVPMIIVVSTALLLTASATLGQHANLLKSPAQRDEDPEKNMNAVGTFLSQFQPQIIAYWGYPVESHEVVTADGYKLTMHRIPHGKTGSLEYLHQTVAGPVVPKGTIFMQHGLLGSSSNWITNLPSLAFGEV